MISEAKNNSRQKFLHCLLAVLATFVAFLCRQVLVQQLHLTLLPFIFFYPVVMFVALLAGLWPGLLATLVSALLADYWIIPPTWSFGIANTSDVIALSFFAGTGVLMSLVAERYRRVQEKAVAYEQELVVQESATKVKQTEAEFEALANAIPQLAWMANPDGWIFWYNERWYSYTGTTPQQMDGWGWKSVHDPEMLTEVLNKWTHSISTGEPFEMVLPLKGADGVFRPFLTGVMPVKNAEGKVVRWFGTNTDISEQKKSEEAVKRTRDLLEMFVENAPAGLAMFDRKMRHLRASRKWFEGTGLAYQDIQGRTHYDVYPNLPERWKEAHRRGLAGESPSGEEPWIAADGSERTTRWAIHPWGDSGTESGGIIIFTEDMTERKRAEEELKRHAQLLRLSFDAIIVWRVDDGIESWNFGAEHLYGYTESEAFGKTTHELLKTRHPRPWPEIQAELKAKGSWEGELRHRARDGREIIVSARHQLLRDADGVERVLETNRDITEGKKIQDELRTSQERLAAIIGSAMDAVITLDANQRIVVFNPAAEGTFGCPLSEALGQSIDRFIPAEFREAHHGYIQNFGRTGATARSMYSPATLYGLRSNGERFPLEATISKGQTGGEELYTVILRDITQRKQAEEALRASEERWATTLHSIGDAVISTDAKGSVDYMNEVAEKLTGWSLEDAKGKDLSEVFDIVQEISRVKPESPAAKVIRLGKTIGLANHTLLVRRDGTEIPIEDSAAPIRDKQGDIVGVVLVFHDASEQRKIEKVLRSNERLATTGRLAATLAHEIHNPLDSVGNLLYLMAHGTKEDGTKELITEATNELARVTQMTQQMLSFQREATKPIPVNIAEILNSVVSLYERKILSAGICVRKQFDVEGRVLALPGELRQVFANLVGNAIEAVGKRKGTIVIHAYRGRNWQTGQTGIRVVVADDGPGIPAGARDKIFEPFFTTKGEKGTGLGLWITSDILHKYQGTIHVRTSTQEGSSGTHFSVFFPFEVKD